MSHHIFPSNLLFALRIPDHTYILYTVSIWVMFLSVTMLCVAEEAFIKISITTAANDARSASGHELTFTVWFHQKVYQCQFAPSQKDTTYTCDASSFIGCDETSAIDGAKILVGCQRDAYDAAIFSNIWIITNTATYGITGVCIPDSEVIGSLYRTKIDNQQYCASGRTHFAELCIDADEPTDSLSCYPPQQMVYFDTTQPNIDIENAVWENGEAVVVSTGNCATFDPTNNPSHVSEHPSQHPTLLPTSKSMFNTMKSMRNLSTCSNLADHYTLMYEIRLKECVELCLTMGDSCRMMDFYYYYKSQHDSRCYIFDDICYVISNKNSNYKMNQSVIYYKSFDPSCSNYPYDWKDNIGDNCDAYTEYNWCDNSTLFRNRNDFEQLVDNKYGLTATDTCCDCGGGTYLIDNVAFSVDEYWGGSKANVLCNFTPQSPNSEVQRKSDSLVLYQLCGYLDRIECAFLMDSQFDSITYTYSMHLCDGTDSVNHPFQFISEHKIDVASLKHDIYVNLLWFDIDPSYYSTNIDVSIMGYIRVTR
eukprot:958677_1